MYCAAQLCIYCVHNSYSQCMQYITYIHIYIYIILFHINCKLAIYPHFHFTTIQKTLPEMWLHLRPHLPERLESNDTNANGSHKGIDVQICSAVGDFVLTLPGCRLVFWQEGSDFLRWNASSCFFQTKIMWV